MKKRKKTVMIILIVIVSSGVICLATLLALNKYILDFSDEKILSPEEAAELEDVDCILVLGCGVKPDGSPSDMLNDRIKTGIDLFERGAAPKLLMSGDHSRKDYNEVGAMKKIAVDSGIASSDVFMDHAGFSTYDSMYRARDIFGCKKIIIVTQEYHLYRAIYIAEKLGIEAYGVSADLQRYKGETYRNLREILARNKDVLFIAFNADPVVLGEKIPISGDGDLTNDY